MSITPIRYEANEAFESTKAFAESKLPEWVAEGHKGQCVLIKNLKVYGFYPTQEAARKEVYEKFGDPKNFFYVQLALWNEANGA